MSRISFPGVSDVLHHVFESLLLPLTGAGRAAALVQPDGEALLVVPGSAADLATLPYAAGLCHKYLALRDGDVAISNDPYSGGTTLSDFAIFVGIKIDAASAGADLLLARRIPLTPFVGASKKLDEEGVRVPPTPLKSGAGPLNRDLLSAIASHPMAPAGFLDAMTSAIEELLEAAEKLRRLSRDPGTILRKANLQQYLDDSALAFESIMTKLPLGTTSSTCTLPTGELLKLQIRILEEHVHFDFAGSEPSTATMALTELATFGACVAAVAAASGEAMPLNAATFHHIHVSAPAKSMLSAANPAPTARGMREGVPAVARFALDTLAKLSPSLKAAGAGSATSGLQAVFEDGRVFAAEIAAGSAAAERSAGVAAANPWSTRAFSFDAEDIETRFPVRFVSLGERASSGGSGVRLGGDGAVVGFELLAPAEIRWRNPQAGRFLEGFQGGRAGSQSHIEIRRSGKREEIKTPQGSAKLSPGDQVFCLTAGGGGFGEPKSKSEDEE